MQWLYNKPWQVLENQFILITMELKELEGIQIKPLESLEELLHFLEVVALEEVPLLVIMVEDQIIEVELILDIITI